VNSRLSLTAAVFRNERSSFRVPSGDPAIPEQQLDGNSRVDGIALGAAGSIGTKWSLFANYTYLDSEVIQSVSDQAILGGSIDILAGDPLPNTPEHSASSGARSGFRRRSRSATASPIRASTRLRARARRPICSTPIRT
jgi:catecholate siderophore receptor